MRTVCCSGCLSCHTWPLPCTPPPPCTPPATHAPPATHGPLCHAHPLPHMPPATHAPLCHIYPLPCMPPPLSIEACKNITFPQLLLRTVVKRMDVSNQFLCLGKSVQNSAIFQKDSSNCPLLLDVILLNIGLIRMDILILDAM